MMGWHSCGISQRHRSRRTCRLEASSHPFPLFTDIRLSITCFWSADRPEFFLRGMDLTQKYSKRSIRTTYTAILLKHFLHIDNIRHHAAENSKMSLPHAEGIWCLCSRILKTLWQRRETVYHLELFLCLPKYFHCYKRISSLAKGFN